ncbi:MAG: hypothetical protein AAGC76_07455 [Luteibacter sp.]|uniref:hypothetical protein n=1 Tax=Luteibacter TaxID=242605 RepID=UPI00055AB0DA|nr:MULTISPECIES: hypothetical protein [unclassified Luteibacter]MDQ7995675.1 hypothetical protein [Luteibacter sp.]MDQ8047763.1 hypothetical protein [Luteibacter sp.]
MHSVKLTVLIEDSADLDMEVRVVAPDIPATVASVPARVTGPRVVVTTATRDEDDYALGGYAGI